jgi:limonene-1,2-epoxide hydrolase
MLGVLSGTTPENVARVLEAFGDDAEAALAALEPMYHPDVRFADPIQTLHGRDAFMAMNRRLLRRARRLSFDVHHHAGGDDVVLLTWTMTYAPSLGPELRFEGSTCLILEDGLVVDHRDYWDLAGSLADAVPVARAVYHRLVGLLA